jgi:WD40 repeat protein
MRIPRAPGLQIGGILLAATTVSCGTAGIEPAQPPKSNSIMEAAPAEDIVASKRTLSLSAEGKKIAWHPSGKVFAVLDADLRVIEFDAQTGKKLKILPTLVRGALSGGIAYSPDGKYLLGGNGVITVFDAATGAKIREIAGPYANDIHGAQGFDTLTISPDSRNVAVRYSMYAHKISGNISVFDIETGAEVFSISEISNKQMASGFSGNLAYTPDGKNLLTSHYEFPTYAVRKLTGEKLNYSAAVDLLDAHSGQRIGRIGPVHVMRATALAVSRNGRYVATGTSTTDKEYGRNPKTGEADYIENEDPIRLWDRETGKLIREFGPLRGAVRALSFNRDGSILASCQTDLTNKETIWLWNVASGRLIQRIRTSGSAFEFFDCSFSPDGRHLAMPSLSRVELIELRK